MSSNQLKIAIIGGGNMGGAIAAALCTKHDVHLSDINQENLSKLKKAHPSLSISTQNKEVIQEADIVILAVKPWLVEDIAQEIKGDIDFSQQKIVSIAAGIDLKTLAAFFSNQAKLFRIIPNTAIEVQQGVFIISSVNTTSAENRQMEELFSASGKVIFVPEKDLNAYMSLTSCGIAYAFRYISAAMKGGVEMGIPTHTAKELVLQTLKGAVELMEAKKSHPEVEIDKVTTPGGITIKGLNEMEAQGFTNAVIKGLKASHIK